ncbi:protein MKS1-like [Neltuma alba]|uniref:protein MKS1-like n=1 Tax=Neltuma alba TaxID=207710 RepID=UPI0010A382B9|nr:protein MKS1-like [Prosopis alba]
MNSQSEAIRMKLQGPRPGPLMANKSSRKMKKKQCSSPVVIYLRSPKVFHVKPEEFMSLVQQLTGNPKPPSSTPSLHSRGTLHRPESEKDAGDEIGRLEHFMCTSRAGPTTHAHSTDFMHFVDFV